jgi:hypothetical protein
MAAESVAGEALTAELGVLLPPGEVPLLELPHAAVRAKLKQPPSRTVAERIARRGFERVDEPKNTGIQSVKARTAGDVTTRGTTMSD